MANKFKVTVITEGLIDAENNKVELARQHMEKAINSPKFKDFVLSYKYSYSYSTGRWWWKKWHVVEENKFSSTNLNNLEVWDRIISGAEVLDPVNDREADIYLKIDRGIARCVGFTYPGSKWQWIYKKFFNSFDPEDLAGNMCHEYCHKVSFNHDYKATARRPYSVPYAVGYWVRDFK